MGTRHTSIIRYFVCFVGGIVFTICVYFVSWIVIFLSWGFEIQSRASFPGHHMARLYSKPGGGDQTYSLVVDGWRVYRSPDAAPGEQKEKLTWNDTGTIVILEYSGEKAFIYDTEKGAEIK